MEKGSKGDAEGKWGYSLHVHIVVVFCWTNCAFAVIRFTQNYKPLQIHFFCPFPSEGKSQWCFYTRYSAEAFCNE